MTDIKVKAHRLSRTIVDAALDVHKILGPGLLESAYEAALERELQLRGLAVARQVPLPLNYKGVTLETAYRIDLLVDNLVVIEIKAVERLEKIHEAQLLSYLKLSSRWLGLLLNFNVPLLKQGIKRMVNS